jgi:hypothetical protein
MAAGLIADNILTQPSIEVPPQPPPMDKSTQQGQEAESHLSDL